MRLISFGSYVFPLQTELSSNAGDIVTRTTRLPSVAGGYDDLGIGPGYSEVVSLRTAFWLDETPHGGRDGTNAPLRAAVDAVYGLLENGVQRLVVDPKNGQPPRYTYARASNVNAAENVQEMPHLRLRVTMNFQIAYPRWMTDAYSAETWGGGAMWGQGATWGGNWPSYPVGAENALYTWGGGAMWGQGATWGAGSSTPITLTNQGNAASLPRLILTCKQAAANGILIERLVGNAAKETLHYTGAIAAGQILDMDCRARRVKLDGSPAYSLFSAWHPDWLPLAPGANTLRVTMPTGGGTLRIYYPHTWYS